MDYLSAVSRVYNFNELEIDFLKEEIKPKEFEIAEVLGSVSGYKSCFLERVDKLGINQDEIKEVKMKIVFDYKGKKRIRKSHEFVADVFWEVMITMANGKVFKKSKKDTWVMDSDKNYKKFLSEISSSS
jgi:hypothetical protein